MSLPILSSPKYDLTIPSTGKKVKFRPFVLKEEKVLLMAQESKDASVIMDAMCDVIETCLDGKITPTELPLFDLEYIFLNLRMKSVGEYAELIFPCQNKECDEKVKVNLNLDSLKIDVPKDAGKIVLDDQSGVGVILRYPSVNEAKKYEGAEMNSDSMVDLIVDCVDVIFDKKTTWDSKEQTKEEIRTFLEHVPSSSFTKIIEFFQNVPKLTHTIEFKCPKCGTQNRYVMEGIVDFFKYASVTKP